MLFWTYVDSTFHRHVQVFLSNVGDTADFCCYMEVWWGVWCVFFELNSFKGSCRELFVYSHIVTSLFWSQIDSNDSNRPFSICSLISTCSDTQRDVQSDQILGAIPLNGRSP